MSGARVELQALSATQAHRAVYGALYGSREVMHLVAEPVAPARLEESFDLSLAASQSAPGLPSRWCVVDRGSDRGLGLAGSVHEPVSGEVELGVLLLAEARGRGHAHDTLTTLMDAFRGCIGVTRFWGRHHPANDAMARVFGRLAFTRSGTADGLCVWRRPATAGDR